MTLSGELSGFRPFSDHQGPDVPQYASRDVQQHCESLAWCSETYMYPCRLSYWIIYTLLLVVETLLWPALKWWVAYPSCHLNAIPWCRITLILHLYPEVAHP